MKATTRTHYELVVARAVSTVRTSIDLALDLHALARDAALAPLHFHRIFRGLLGETPVAMHRRLRLERAATELATTDASVTRIAFTSGYETHESFTRAFRDAFGSSPTDFRRLASAPATAWSTASRCRLSALSGIHFGSPPDEEPIFHQRKGATMNVTLHDLPARRVAAVLHRGPYSGIADAFARLDQVVRTEGLDSLPGTEMVAVYHDDPDTTPPSELRAHAGLVLPPDVPVPAPLEEVALPAGRYARTLHVGSYEHLADAWSRFMGEWLAASPHRVGSGPAYERYRNTPMTTAPEALETELYLSIADVPR